MKELVDFLIENGGRKVAIEIDDEAFHNYEVVSQNKFYVLYLGDIYLWTVRQMQQQCETIQDELGQRLCGLQWHPACGFESGSAQ